MTEHLRNRVIVVGIGVDGYDGLAPSARTAIDEAGVVIGGARQLELLPASVTAQRVTWPTPLRPAVRQLVEAHRDAGLVVLGSGDPMHHGIGRTLIDELGQPNVKVIPHPGSVSLACARMGWAVESTPVASTLTAPLAAVLRHAGQGRRLLVLNRDAGTPAALAGLLTEAGFGGSRITVLSDLGGRERSLRGFADQVDYWGSQAVGGVSVSAVEFAGAPSLPETHGLPDEAFASDGQLTKRHVRALTLSTLAPRPGELLWDIGGGSGSIAIEWLRAHPSMRAVCVEKDPVRAERIVANAAALGVPALEVVTGGAPEAMAGLPTPDVVFVGGGLTADGVFDACWAALPAGGRFVANAVTLESQALVTRLRAERGGELVKIDVARSTPVGAFTGWRAAMTVVQWSAEKGAK
ncbi:precorrin-6y C5,15-methyltransferase (decarboxylating) subunit CbiE [Nocardioides cavernaquae]|uniref:Precorrin-6y C5,15-methyltransferase (Decarboxylating) subunit CbiE n=1 Tax=Nocardioides cavernaquae TaxID=2321396 RepID=A0A3A5H839_9ACTN|nr:precorrin-6y C5,15-methyltransferase (decarboxylating) subunit CbiE [Nocardioides cavernaquae]RJS45565.1 precorrin-6y C5,15-methyltransferase (decarboxylating) subunit CbiE [Nocardioides cavernaquae]